MGKSGRKFEHLTEEQIADLHTELAALTIEACDLVDATDRIDRYSSLDAQESAKATFQDVNSKLLDLKSRVKNTENLGEKGARKKMLRKITRLLNLTTVEVTAPHKLVFRVAAGTRSEEFTLSTQGDYAVITVGRLVGNNETEKGDGRTIVDDDDKLDEVFGHQHILKSELCAQILAADFITPLSFDIFTMGMGMFITRDDDRLEFTFEPNEGDQTRLVIPLDYILKRLEANNEHE
jgi:hypothetical protein